MEYNDFKRIIIEKLIYMQTVEDCNGEPISLSDEEVYMYENEILSHPRSKEVISYLEKEVEREFPGFVEYLNNNFPYYKWLTSLKYVEDSDFEKLYDMVIIDECKLLSRVIKN